YPLLLSSFSLFFALLLLPTAPTVTHTLSLHDALPISLTDHCTSSHSPSSLPIALISSDSCIVLLIEPKNLRYPYTFRYILIKLLDRKSTRLNSSHVKISYAVFCLKKKTHRTRTLTPAW